MRQLPKYQLALTHGKCLPRCKLWYLGKPFKSKHSISVKDFKMALCQKSEIGLEIERSNSSSDRVCHARARKIRTAFELHNFISSSLQKRLSTLSRVWSTFQTCIRCIANYRFVAIYGSPQTRKGHKTSLDNSIAVKFDDALQPRNNNDTGSRRLASTSSDGLLRKRPSHLSHEANCLPLSFLLVFGS